MTLAEMTELFRYNHWANNRLLEAVAQLPASQYTQDMKISHGSIHGTLVHIVAAQKIWLSRWLENPDSVLLQGKDIPTLVALVSLWEKVSSETADFVSSLTDEKLEKILTMTTTRGKEYHHTYREMMLHLINHSSTHRGQVSGMMRQMGVPPPPIDLIAYYRSLQK